MSRDHLLTERPGITTCAKCHVPVMAAVVNGLQRHADICAINAAGELQALRAGLATFELRGNLLIRRTVDHIRATERPAPTVLAEHSCHPIPDRFIDGDHMSRAILLATKLLGATPVDVGDVPPF